MLSLVHAGSGTIDVKEMKAALEAMGQHPTDEELFVMIHQVSLSLIAMCMMQFVCPKLCLHVYGSSFLHQQHARRWHEHIVRSQISKPTSRNFIKQQLLCFVTLACKSSCLGLLLGPTSTCTTFECTVQQLTTAHTRHYGG